TFRLPTRSLANEHKHLYVACGSSWRHQSHHRYLVSIPAADTARARPYSPRGAHGPATWRSLGRVRHEVTGPGSRQGRGCPRAYAEAVFGAGANPPSRRLSSLGTP